jgi:hypothetical protein
MALRCDRDVAWVVDAIHKKRPASRADSKHSLDIRPFCFNNTRIIRFLMPFLKILQKYGLYPKVKSAAPDFAN